MQARNIPVGVLTPAPLRVVASPLQLALSLPHPTQVAAARVDGRYRRTVLQTREQCSVVPQTFIPLAEIYIWFTERFDTRARQEAKVLLHDLSQAGGFCFTFVTLGVFPSGSRGAGRYLHPLLLSC